MLPEAKELINEVSKLAPAEQGPYQMWLIVTLIRDAKLTIDLRRAQNRYYRLRATVRPAIEASATISPASREWLELFDELGEKLSIAPG